MPTGFIESIGATVQHLDEFGVKPPQQTPIYIPPAAHEIALSGSPSTAPVIYGAPVNQQAPPTIIVQQLPQLHQGPTFLNGPPSVKSLQHPHYIPLPQEPQSANALNQYFPDRPSANIHFPSHQPINNNGISQQKPSFDYSQAFSLTQKIPRPNQQTAFSTGRSPSHHHQTQIVLHDCAQGPNLVHQQQQFNSISANSPDAYNAIAQSVPVAEQHTQFLADPTDSYSPPPSGSKIEFDHLGYASQKSAVSALPDGTDLQQLPGLDGLNVISTQKSQSIKFGTGIGQPLQNFQVQFGSSLNNAASIQGSDTDINDPSANHEEILSQGLLQSILTAIEQPQSSSSVPQSYSAQSRSDEHYKENHNKLEKQHQDASANLEVRALPGTDEKYTKDKDIKPIAAAEVNETAQH